jgi:FKBP-type peptidyl-prolyl cis-trans isomerase
MSIPKEFAKQVLGFNCIFAQRLLQVGYACPDPKVADLSVKLILLKGVFAMDQSNKLEGTKMAGFDPMPAVTQLQIIDLEPGDGDAVPEGATITAHYTGALAKDGTIFQSSHDFGDAISFGLDQVIAGWTKGVPGMKVGGTRRLIIPAAMAYGPSSPSPNIPPNSDLVFDIELIRIN